MAKVSPAIVAVPCRFPSELAATVSCTVPFPEPFAPEATLIHGALLEAVHEQPAGAVTATEAEPPAFDTFWLCGEIESVHPPLSVTVKVCPPAVIVPVRCGPLFAAAV